MNVATRRALTPSPKEPVFEPSGNSPFEGLIDFQAILSFLRRRWRLIAIGAAAGLILAIVFLISARSLYTGTATILIDKRQTIASDRPAGVDGVFKDDAAILSEVELLRSRRIENKVIEQFNLDRNDDFAKSYNGPVIQFISAVIQPVVSTIAELISPPDPPGPETERRQRDKRREKIYARFDKNVDVQRVNASYALQIDVTVPEPWQAVKLTTAFAEHYLNDQIAARFEATQRLDSWLLQRIDEVRRQAAAAESEVVQFRADNNLDSVSGKLLTEQQQLDINAQLSAAKGAVDQAEAKLNQVRTVIASGLPEESVSDLLINETVRVLRDRFLVTQKEESEIVRKLGREHFQAQQRRDLMADYQRQINSELRRIASSYESDFRIAKGRYDQLERALKQSTVDKADSSGVMAKLREKEQRAATINQLQSNLLRRYSELMNERDFPLSEARIIGLPVQPTDPSKPNKLLIFALALVGGAGIGGLIGLWREFRERFFRSAEQIRETLGVPFLGYAPLLDPAPLAPRPGAFSPADARLHHVRDLPMSTFSESLRAARVALDRRRNRDGKLVIGIISALPNEGKTMVAANLAWLLAGGGTRNVLLVDADIRNPGLTRGLAPRATSGLTNVLLDRAPLSEALLSTDIESAKFLPCILRGRGVDSADLLASSITSAFISAAGARFDDIILDLPPLSPVVDARAVADQVDAFIMVVRWGETAQDVVKRNLKEDSRIAEKCIGVILNGVDMNKLPFYSDYAQDEYYASAHYGAYIRES